MDASFIPIETVPSKAPFGLDQLRRSYKTSLSAEAAIAAAPNVGDPDEIFPNMFLMPVTTPESAQAATRLDLVYMGSFSGEAGSPVLPAQKHEYGTQIQSASSSWGSAGALIGTVSVQFYAPSNVLSYMSFGGPGTDEATDPTADPVVVTITVGAANFAPGTTAADIASSYFSTQIVHALNSTEIVPGQYWQNDSRKTKVFIPYLISVPAGTAIIGLSAPGANYQIGDDLTITAGGESAVLHITALGVGQSVLAFSTTSNTFTSAHGGLAATGGIGTGAAFNVIIV